MFYMLTYLFVSFIIYVIVHPLMLLPLSRVDEKGEQNVIILGPALASFLWPLAVVMSIWTLFRGG
jgi:hypothetical protein